MTAVRGESAARLTPGSGLIVFRAAQAGSTMAEGQITRWLEQWRAGDSQVLERLIPLVYQELRVLARRQLRRESPAHSLSSAALVHEVYLRLLQQRQLAA